MLEDILVRLRIPSEPRISPLTLQYGVRKTPSPIDNTLVNPNIFVEPPPTPHNLTILDIKSRSVKVSWTLEMASPGVDRLVVQWKEQSGNLYFIFKNMFKAM